MRDCPPAGTSKEASANGAVPTSMSWQFRSYDRWEYSWRAVFFMVSSSERQLVLFGDSAVDGRGNFARTYRQIRYQRRGEPMARLDCPLNEDGALHLGGRFHPGVAVDHRAAGLVADQHGAQLRAEDRFRRDAVVA